MTPKLAQILERFPAIDNLRGKVPDEVIEEEVFPNLAPYDELMARSREVIPTVFLGQIFGTTMEQGRIVLERFLGQWGNLSVEEVCKVCLIAAWLKPSSIFEFGTFNGMTTLQLAQNTPGECTIYTLDVEPGSDEANALDVGPIDLHLATKTGAFDFEVGSFFLGSSYARRVQQLFGDSSKLDLSAYENSIDLVFVDAGHTYEYIRSDTENALKMLRPGGVIVWHDFAQVLHPDVTRCLVEYAETGLPIHHLRNTFCAIHYKAESNP